MIIRSLKYRKKKYNFVKNAFVIFVEAVQYVCKIAVCFG